jgi:hypothetical protein
LLKAKIITSKAAGRTIALSTAAIAFRNSAFELMVFAGLFQSALLLSFTFSAST